MKTVVKISLSIIVAFVFFSNAMAQDDQPQGRSYVKIKTMKIINGDTTITEKEYSGDGSMIIQDSLSGGDIGSFSFDFSQPGMDSRMMKNFSDIQKMMSDFDFGMGNLEFPDFHMGFGYDSIINEFNFRNFDSIMHGMNNYNMKIKRFWDTLSAKSDSLSEIEKPEMRMQIFGKDDKGRNIELSKKIIITDVIPEKKEKKESALLNLSIFPNPTGGYFNVVFSLDPDNKTFITITDISGKQLIKETAGKSEGLYTRHFDLSSFTAGTYIINIKQGKKQISKKIMID